MQLGESGLFEVATISGLRFVLNLQEGLPLFSGPMSFLGHGCYNWQQTRGKEKEGEGVGGGESDRTPLEHRLSYIIQVILLKKHVISMLQLYSSLYICSTNCKHHISATIPMT